MKRAPNPCAGGKMRITLSAFMDSRRRRKFCKSARRNRGDKLKEKRLKMTIPSDKLQYDDANEIEKGEAFCPNCLAIGMVRNC
jgi:hypothetical protein